MQPVQTLAETIRPWATSRSSLPDLHLSSLSISTRFGVDPLHVRAYLAGFGLGSANLEQLASSVAALENEEELSAIWVTEGLLIRQASDGWLMLVVR